MGKTRCIPCQVTHALISKKAIAIALVVVIAAAVALGSISTPIEANRKIAMLEAKADSGQNQYNVYGDGAQVYAVDCRTETVVSNTSNPLEASALINSLLNSLPVLRSLVTIKFIGDFTVTKPIQIPSYCVLNLREAKLKLGDYADCDLFTNSQHILGNEMVAFIGGVLDGNKARQTGEPRTNPSSVLIHLYMTHEILIRDVQLRDAKWENILLTYSCFNAVIRNVESTGAGYNGVTTELGTHDVLIEKCAAHGNEIDGVLLCWNNGSFHGIRSHDGYNITVQDCDCYWNGIYGVSVEGYGTAADIKVRHCSIYGNGFSGIHVGTGHNILIEGCTVTWNRWDGLRVEVYGQDPAAETPVTGLTVRGNTFSDNTLYGVRLLGSQAEPIRNVAVIGNRFTGESLSAENATHITVSGNTGLNDASW